MLEEVAQELENAKNKGDLKKLFAGVQKLCGSTNNKIIILDPVKNKNDELVTEKVKIMDRWKKHFQELLNKNAPNNMKKP